MAPKETRLNKWQSHGNQHMRLLIKPLGNNQAHWQWFIGNQNICRYEKGGVEHKFMEGNLNKVLDFLYSVAKLGPNEEMKLLDEFSEFGVRQKPLALAYPVIKKIHDETKQNQTRHYQHEPPRTEDVTPTLAQRDAWIQYFSRHWLPFADPNTLIPPMFVAQRGPNVEISHYPHNYPKPDVNISYPAICLVVSTNQFQMTIESARRWWKEVNL